MHAALHAGHHVLLQAGGDLNQHATSLVKEVMSALPRGALPSAMRGPWAGNRATRPDVWAKLTSETREIHSMDDMQEAKYATAFAKYARAAFSKFHNGTEYVANKEGMPVIFWSPATKSKDIFVLASKVAERAWTKCEDEEDSAIVLIDRRGRPLWPLVIMSWITHFAEHGHGDSITGLDFDVGYTNQALQPTLLAHMRHGQPFFAQDLLSAEIADLTVDRFIAGSNARPQSWLVNKWLRSHRGAYLAQAVRDAKAPCMELLRRLRSAGLLICTEDNLKAIEKHDTSAAVSALANNSRLPSERGQGA